MERNSVLATLLVIAGATVRACVSASFLFKPKHEHNKDSNASVYQNAERKENKFRSSKPLNSVR